MHCISPINIPRPNGRGNSDRIDVPCGKCAPCLNRKRNEWSFRLQQEFKANTSSYFVTLTYDNEHIKFNTNGYPSVNKRDVQLFIKRLRKAIAGTRPLRYYLTAEYGTTTQRPHYHAILFGLADTRDHAVELISRTWTLGNIHVGTVTGASIAYCTKYVIQRQLVEEGYEPVFTLVSRRPGIGANYLYSHAEYHGFGDPRFYGILDGGAKVALPRYYSEKFYDSDVRAGRVIDFKPILDHDAYLARYPTKNPFEYEYELKKDYSDRLFNRVTKSQKI